VIGAAVAMEHYGIAVRLALLNLFALGAVLPFKKWLDRNALSGSESVDQHCNILARSGRP
jgi:hypothetical protein